MRSAQLYLWYYSKNTNNILELPDNLEDFNDSLVELADNLDKGKDGQEDRREFLAEFIDEATKFMKNLNAQITKDL